MYKRQTGIRLTLHEQEIQFDNEVNEALVTVVDEIDKRENKYLEELANLPRKEYEIQSVINQPIEIRLGHKKGAFFIDSLLKKAVNKLGAGYNYHYGVYSDRDSGFVVIDNKFTVPSLSRCV